MNGITPIKGTIHLKGRFATALSLCLKKVKILYLEVMKFHSMKACSTL